MALFIMDSDTHSAIWKSIGIGLLVLVLVFGVAFPLLNCIGEDDGEKVDYYGYTYATDPNWYGIGSDYDDLDVHGLCELYGVDSSQYDPYKYDLHQVLEDKHLDYYQTHFTDVTVMFTEDSVTLNNFPNTNSTLTGTYTKRMERDSNYVKRYYLDCQFDGYDRVLTFKLSDVKTHFTKETPEGPITKYYNMDELELEYEDEYGFVLTLNFEIKNFVPEF